MTNTNQTSFTVLNSGLIHARGYLQSKFSKVDKKNLDNLTSIEIIDGEIPGEYAIDKKREDVLKVSRTFAENNKVIMELKAVLDSAPVSDKADRCYVGEAKQIEDAKSKEIFLDPEEKKSQASLGILSNILDRAYNRRTTLTGWILYFMLGLKDDDFGPMSELLKDAKFAKDFTKYRKEVGEGNKSGAESYLTSAFEKKAEDKISPEEKQKSVKRASFLIDNYNKLNLDFVTLFPKIFCLQNMAMPFLKMFMPKVKLFDFMVTINPWIYDLVSENLGNYAGEIKAIQAVEKETNKEKVVSEINLTPLDFEQFSLQKIMKDINSGIERIFGKDSTISSMLLKKWLKSNRGMEYQEFANKFTEDTANEGFIKKLYEGLKGNTNTPEDIFKQEKTPEAKDKYWVAAIVSRIARVATSVTPEWIKENSNRFGAIFVPLNLTMPLIAKVFNKGFLGFITHTLLKVFPIANELVFDHLANFRKEILDIQNETNDESKSISKLFPKIEVKSKWQAFTNSVSYLYNAIKGFASKKPSINPAGT